MSKVAQSAMEQTPRFIVALLQTTKEMIDMLLKMLKDMQEIYSAQLLSKHLQDKNDIDFQTCKGFTKEEFGKILNEYKIPHMFMQDEKTGEVICVTRDCDRELVKDARNELFRRQRGQSKVSYVDFCHLNAGTKIMSFNNLSDVEEKRFSELASAHGFIMSTVKHENGTNSVYFSAKDYKKAQAAFEKTVLDTLGVNGKTMETHYKREIDNMKKAYETFTNSKANAYVISTANPKEFIHFRGNEFDRVRGNKILTVSKIDDNFAQDAFNQSMELSEPMILSKEDYENVNKLIDQYAKENNLPRNKTASTILTFINKEYNSDVNKFMNDLESDKTRFVIKENYKGQSYLQIKTDNPKEQFTKEDVKKMKLEKDVRSLLDKNPGIDAETIIKELGITDDKEIQHVNDYITEFDDRIRDEQPEVSFVDKEELRDAYEQDNKYYDFMDEPEK